MPRRRKKSDGSAFMGCLTLVGMAVGLWLLWIALQYWVALAFLGVGAVAAFHLFRVADKSARIFLAGTALVGLGLAVPNFQGTSQRLRAEAAEVRRLEAQREQARLERERKEAGARAAAEREANRTFTIVVTTRQKSTIELYEKDGWDAMQTVEGRTARFAAKRGEYEVKVKADGYWPKVVPVSVAGADRNLAVALEPNPTGQVDALDGRGDGVRAVYAAPQTSAASDVFYANCRAARAAGVAPISAGEPGYRSKLDGDGDGVACE